MIRVYATPDCSARAITFSDGDAPPAPLELLREFDAGEREAAWEFLHELGKVWAWPSSSISRTANH
jgi:hypothetical protein